MGFDGEDKSMIMDEKISSSLSSSDGFSSMNSGDEEEVNSSLSSSSTSSLSHSITPPSDHPTTDPLSNMSSLLQQLPIKRGLSLYYEGRSKSFTCLTNVKSLEDLAKPENPYNKRLKSCKSYVGPNMHKSGVSSRVISKKAHRASSSSSSPLIAKRINKPPTNPPSRSNSTTHFANPTPTQIQTPNQTTFFV